MLQYELPDSTHADVLKDTSANTGEWCGSDDRRFEDTEWHEVYFAAPPEVSRKQMRMELQTVTGTQ